MAKKKAAKKETKSEFLRKSLRRNPDLDYDQIDRKWAKTGHAGVISNPLYYKVRGELGIRTEWVRVKESGPEIDEGVMTRPAGENRPNDDLVEAAEDVLPKILMFYKLFEDKRPVLVFDLQSQQILAYPYGEYKATLGERSQAMLATQYKDDKPRIEWSWEGNDEMDQAQGRGWAVLDGERLKGMIFFHQGDESEFEAERDVVEGD